MKVKLKDVASFSKGQQINGDDLLLSANYAYLNGGISPSGYWNEYNIPANSIAISEGGNSCGYVNYMQSPFWCGAHCYYLFDLKISNTKYLYYALKARQDDIMKLRSGACMPNIKKSDLGEFAFEFDFDDDHQTIVVDQLERVERMITLRQHQLSKLDELVKSRFIELFGDVKTNEFGWEKCRFGDVTVKITDGEHGTVPRVNKDEGYLYFMARNITKRGEIDLSETSYVPKEVHEKIFKRCNPEQGDILLVCVGATIGKSTIVPQNMGVFSMARSVALIKPDAQKVNNVFLHALLKSDAIQNDISSCAHAAAQAGLYTNMIISLDAFVPPMELQEQFAAFVEQTDKSKFEIQKSLEKLETLKKALMQKYFG